MRPTVYQALLVTALLACSQASAADPQTAAVRAQASVVYAEQCSGCHGTTMQGGESGPALVGDVFTKKWRAAPDTELHDFLKTKMPPATPGSLTDPQYTQLTTWLRSGDGLDMMALAQSTAPTNMTEWLYNRSSPGAGSYSPLDVINKDNVKNLKIAWRFKTENFGAAIESNYEATPLMIDGVLYTTAGRRRDAVALDARTGETLWMYRIDEGAREKVAPRRNSGRGVSFGRIAGKPTIYLVTPGFQLIALDAKTGRPVETFGTHGIVDIKTQLDQNLDPLTAPIGNTSPPLVMNGVVVVGAALESGSAPKTVENVQAHIVGFDAATGKRIWIFHTTPQPGEFGADTWKGASAAHTGNAGVWSVITGDPARGYVYLPIEEATGDFYGGHRPGDNLFSQTLVCLDVKTGKRVWHFQMIHHGIWDYDLPAPPVLIDVKTRSGTIPMVVQVTKQAFAYVFNRETGKPIWPIIERKVVQSTADGERTAPTQPIPTKPLAYDMQGSSNEMLNDLTPEILAEAKKIAQEYTMGPLFTPPTTITATNKGTLFMPGASGGTNWQGAAADPETGILYVPSMTYPYGVGLTPADPKTSDQKLITPSLIVKGPFGLPLTRPPWGRITAIDLSSGDHLWQVASGDTPAEIRDHPKLNGVTLPRTGSIEIPGLLVTKSLLFAGEGAGLFVPPGGGRAFHAFDKKTGELIFEIMLPLRQSGIPMTYAIDGKQFIVVPTGDRGQAGELIALTLP